MRYALLLPYASYNSKQTLAASTSPVQMEKSLLPKAASYIGLNSPLE